MQNEVKTYGRSNFRRAWASVVSQPPIPPLELSLDFGGNTWRCLMIIISCSLNIKKRWARPDLRFLNLLHCYLISWLLDNFREIEWDVDIVVVTGSTSRRLKKRKKIGWYVSYGRDLREVWPWHISGELLYWQVVQTQKYSLSQIKYKISNYLYDWFDHVCLLK